jgi:uncharacterized protein
LLNDASLTRPVSIRGSDVVPDEPPAAGAVGDWVVVGKVVPPSSTEEFTALIDVDACRLGEVLAVHIGSKAGSRTGADTVVWGRVSTVEVDPERRAFVARLTPLGSSLLGEAPRLDALMRPVRPGASVLRPSVAAVQALVGTSASHEPTLRLGTLLARPEIAVGLSAERVVSHHLAILAMTGAGKTVAVRRLIRELMQLRYPVVVLDPHGDYLSLAQNRRSLGGAKVRVFHPYLTVTPSDRSLLEALIEKTAQEFSGSQKELLEWLLKAPPKKQQTVTGYLETLLETSKEAEAGVVTGAPRVNWNTYPVVRRALGAVHSRLSTMAATSERLRRTQLGITFEPLPDVRRQPAAVVAPHQLSIVYLAGYEDVIQSAVASILLEGLFEHRTALEKGIPPVLTVVEEAHTFVPAGRSPTDVPSLTTLRRIMTEGRKFGMGAILVSQRPSLVDPTALAQCNSFLAMRLVNSQDQAHVGAIVENLSSSEIGSLATLGPGQGIVAGQAVRMPAVVQVEFDRDLLEDGTSDGAFVQEAAEWRTREVRRAKD